MTTIQNMMETQQITATFSRTTSHIFAVLTILRETLAPYLYRGENEPCINDRDFLKQIISDAIGAAAVQQAVRKSTVHAAVTRNLELPFGLDEFCDLAADYFMGGTTLIDIVCAHAKTASGKDDVTMVRAMLEQIRA